MNKYGKFIKIVHLKSLASHQRKIINRSCTFNDDDYSNKAHLGHL